MNKHLHSDYTIEELGKVLCQDCRKYNMAEYACINFMKDNEALCINCCYCHREEA